MATNYTKMTVYKLKEVLNSQYNRTDEKRHHRSVLFLIENSTTGNQTLYEIDRISKRFKMIVEPLKSAYEKLI